ncbi:MAG: hypothetical protein CM1200mP12_16430 [Gammaproteobacteria bacterium]|nr:MAG: hypothetical protein CM1200mP12_16430 [Gammaproteobacteria bacterium]
MNELFLSDIFLGVIAFTVSVNLMVIVILISRKFLIATGNVEIQLNEDPDRILQVQAGDKLLQTLANEEMFLSSACGGKGTCAQCKWSSWKEEEQYFRLKKPILQIMKKGKVGGFHVRFQ